MKNLGGAVLPKAHIPKQRMTLLTTLAFSLLVLPPHLPFDGYVTVTLNEAKNIAFHILDNAQNWLLEWHER